MFTTALTALAMTGVLSAGNLIPAPQMVPDYATALRMAEQDAKPVVVFIAKGNDGLSQVLPNATLTPEAQQRLKNEFVSVFIDTSTKEGQATAKAFELEEGLVISDRGGHKQALRHTGPVTSETLSRYLERYATVTTVSTTESVQNNPVKVDTPSVNPYSYCPSCQQGYRRFR